MNRQPQQNVHGVIAPFSTIRLRLELCPRRLNPDYRKQITIINEKVFVVICEFWKDLFACVRTPPHRAYVVAHATHTQHRRPRRARRTRWW